MNPQLESILSEIEKAVVGKRGVIEKILMALLAEGHILLDDVPGVGKTTTSVNLSACVAAQPYSVHAGRASLRYHRLLRL